MKLFVLIVCFVLCLAIANASQRPSGSSRPRRPAGKGGKRKSGARQRSKVTVPEDSAESSAEVDISPSSISGSKKWGLVSKLPVALGGTITVGALAWGGLKKWKAAKATNSDSDRLIKKAKPGKGKTGALKIDSHQDFLSIISSKEDAFKGGEVASIKGKYTLLIFDCDASLGDAADKKARIDYFGLMQNLTATAAAREGNAMEVVYVPGKGNKSIMESDDGSSAWKYISSSGKTGGPDVSAAIRDKVRKLIGLR